MDDETRQNFTEVCHLKYELNRIYPTNYISECINHLCSNQQLDPMGFDLIYKIIKKIRPKKFYNESTKMTFVIVDKFSNAGILKHLDRSTKWLLFDQFDNIGLIQQKKGKKSKSANPFDCRSLMMQLCNGLDDYTKVLSAELQQLESARVILTEASSGAMIQAVNSQ
ncbi:unnamed protein product [Didymodactylos carnosus]|uniref:Uncharacterized protein n=1 Tax=Didymodactylos carnosus TaxID=1234261 RepID=A0A8S2JHY4_9BILA|nr:unnamed protein product [Didymodactylos carnosus]CAF3799450.1 unnamed protein product [Didymodactylos carnosus]CAF4404101.1 unnamed protein product [Didymodactylos carnosus]